MTIDQSRGTHVSRYLANLRIERGLKPGQLAFILQARNISKIGSLIKQFELNGDISPYWFKKLINELNPKKDVLQKCIKQDQEAHRKEIEEQQTKWNQWADKPIDPYLTIRYIPAVYGTKSIPKAFTSLRADAEWWCSNELKSLRAKGYLNWTRREQTFFDKGGSHLYRCSATFEEPPVSAWMQISGSSEKFIFKEELSSTEKVQTKTEV
tara:strand:- start:48 stop:677 length:630 start_codon:yes stop_codon:yes gene_type:complete